MKLLTLIRHAKSSWKEPGLSDFERPLNKRGRRDAPAMAQRLASVDPRPDLLLASPAERARLTAEAMAAALALPEEAVVFDRSLYLASVHDLLGAVQALDDDWRHVALVGHNPGLTDLVELFAHAGIDNLPTCGIARLELPIDGWPDARPGCARLLGLETPKREA